MSEPEKTQEQILAMRKKLAAQYKVPVSSIMYMGDRKFVLVNDKNNSKKEDK